MPPSNPVSRRTLLHLGLAGGVGALVAGFLPAAPDPDCATPAQTSGPFFPVRPPLDSDADLTVIQGRTDRAEGVVVHVNGQVLDGNLRPVGGALVDVWQANHHGRYAHEADPNPAPLDAAFQGSAQLRTDAEGRYAFTTIVPGAYPAEDDWMRPPHIHFKVARRGFHELITQMYFAGEALNDVDRLLLAVPEADRETLVVDFATDATGLRRGTFTLILQRVA